MTEASETAGAGPEPALLLADGVGGFYAVPAKRGGGLPGIGRLDERGTQAARGGAGNW